MLDDKYTRCPACATVFRVAPEQLAMRGGKVRCGQCKTVFDGIAQEVSLSPPAHPVAATSADTAVSPGSPEHAAPAPDPLSDAAVEIPAPATALVAEAAEAAPADRFAPPARTSRRMRAAMYAIAAVVLLLLIAAQATYHFRDSIVTYWPFARPSFERFCAAAGCAIRPLRDSAMSHLSIEASDLQADPAHRGLLILTATLRNRSAWPLAYPHLELTLTDAQDRVVVRRALAPADYAGGTADPGKGIGANAEVTLKVFIDASATTQAGYRLYMFYP
jgi:predicted Zn finger-like uncharacterized protein